MAPATYNTINKWAAGIADTYPLTQLAELTGGKLMVVPGAGHLPGGRYPVIINLAIREFVDSLALAGASR